MHLVGRAGPKIAAELMKRRRASVAGASGYDRPVRTDVDSGNAAGQGGARRSCPGLWVLVATDGQNEMPMLDDAEIPLITPGQRAKVSEGWIDNVHRGKNQTTKDAKQAKEGAGIRELTMPRLGTDHTLKIINHESHESHE